MKELDFLKSKGLIKEGFTEFIISGDFGKVELTELLKEYKTEQLRLHVVVSSNMRKALTTVVRGYEGDGMENMQIRDEVFYKTCKEALTFDDSTKD